MYCENKLRAKMAEKGLFKITDLSDKSGISYATLLRRVLGASEWERKEITAVANALEMTDADIMAIFFAE